jgi:hypothetical protein
MAASSPQPTERGNEFMTKVKAARGDELRIEYRREDVGKGVRGKYFAACRKGSNLVLLTPEPARAFPTSEALNEALRGLLQLTEKTSKLTRRGTARATSGRRTG